MLDAFDSETRTQAFFRGQRRIIRAQCENGLLVLREEFVRLPYERIETGSGCNQDISTNAELYPRSDKSSLILSDLTIGTALIDRSQTSGKEKIRQLLYHIVQMYALQFKIMDNVLGILKSELRLKEAQILGRMSDRM